MVIIDINDKWQFRQKGGEYFPARVPGSQYEDLLALGQIPDPYREDNESKTEWVADKDFIYSRKLSLPEEMKGKEHIILRCECLDTLAEVTLDGDKIGSHDNYFLPFEADVTGRIGEDSLLEIYFRSPAEYLREKQREDVMPRNCNGMNGIPHIRKPGCHFGWDWGPFIPTVGIASDIRLIAWDGAMIEDVFVKQTHRMEEKEADIHAEVRIKYSPKAGARAEIVLLSPQGELLGRKEIEITGEAFDADFTVKNPELWWSHDICDRQPLYTVRVTLIQGEEEQVKERRIGLRTIQLDRSADKYGTNFRFILNGVPLFIKGSNYIPPDALLTRVNTSVYERLLGAVKRANMNMVRVWGGGRYETDEFYDICDREGILVWQDFMFACNPYPFYNEQFRENVLKEAEYNVKRLRNRPCLALWCGNNEIETMSAGWLPYTKLREWTEKFFWHILPENLKKWDDVTPFIPGSPVGKGYMDGVASDEHGDVHMWTVWHGLQPLTYYRKRFSRFCSEFGLESMPDMNTIRSFCPEDQLDLTSPVMQAHQKCPSGNGKIAYYTSTRFRLPEKFEDTVYLSQIVQSECVRDATEHWRRNRGRCNGSMYWQLNDCWPVLSWSSIDYYGGYKALQYTARHFNAPLTASACESKNGVELHIINDKDKPFKGNIEYTLYTFHGKKLASGRAVADCPAASARKVCSPDIKGRLRHYRHNCVLQYSLKGADEKVVCTRTVLFKAEKKLALPDPSLALDISVNAGVASIKVRAEKYARYVKLFAKGVAQPFSDNYFDLVAGEEKTVTLPLPDGTDAEQAKQIISVTSIAGIKPKQSRFADFLFRMKIRLIPINIANWVAYHFM